ncbi:Uncharacterized protein Adt_11816 [Abeliophyllum distichum]|uniref:Uncharacterized protein n=1 Tax=Abeliophyllum distichum TaxID=126358 RepID=A0ABD1UPA2_9LAMI
MSNEIFISQKPTDTINISTFKRMKIVKEQEQWMLKTRRFDAKSGHSTLLFEGDEVMDDDDQDEEDVPPSSPTRDMPQSVHPLLDLPSPKITIIFSMTGSTLLSLQWMTYNIRLMA